MRRGHGKNRGALQGYRTVRLYWGGLGELAERDFMWVRAVTDGAFEYKLINCKEFPLIF